MGLRVDRLAMVAEASAWVLLSGRNPDGSEYRLSDLWIRDSIGWTRQELPKCH
jgi:hypothetical protein